MQCVTRGMGRTGHGISSRQKAEKDRTIGIKWVREREMAKRLAAEFKWKIVCGKVHQGQNLIRQALNFSSCSSIPTTFSLYHMLCECCWCWCDITILGWFVEQPILTASKRKLARRPSHKEKRESLISSDFIPPNDRKKRIGLKWASDKKLTFSIFGLASEDDWIQLFLFWCIASARHQKGEFWHIRADHRSSKCDIKLIEAINVVKPIAFHIYAR